MRAGRILARGWGLAAALALGLLVGAVFEASGVAAEAPPPLFWKKCELGNGAGKCSLPRGIAVDSNTPGHVFVADQSNQRVDEFTAWGQFVKTWGWDVDATTLGTGFEVCTAKSGDVCKAGSGGGGAGQFSSSAVEGITIDSSGDVYVVDEVNRRVQKFDPSVGLEGEEVKFLRMWGKGVNTGTSGKADLCTNAGPPTDVCGKGEEGGGNGQFNGWTVGNYIATGPANTIYVGDKERIQKFNTEGEFTGKIEGGALVGKAIGALAVDSSGNPYVAFFLSEGHSAEGALKLGPAGETLCTLKPEGEAQVKNPGGIATDGAGHIYVYDRSTKEVRRFDRSSCVESGAPIGAGEVEESTGLAVGETCLATGSDLYVANSVQLTSFVNAYGRHPDNPECPAPEHAPEILSQYAASVDPEGAQLKASIDPKFFPSTRYFVQYGTGECSAGGCPEEQPASPGSLLTAEVTEQPLTTPAVLLAGLEPHTTYHYRFIAFSKSEGEKHVFGIDPDGEGPEEASAADGLEGTIRTPQRIPLEHCAANENFRSGFSTALPDCRAYEMVSPVDKSNGSVIELCANSCTAADGLDQSAPGPEGKLTYSAYRAFGGAKSAQLGVQYLASRGAGGWASEAIAPPSTQVPIERNLQSLETPFQTFSADLCEGWLNYQAEPPLDPLAPANGLANLYRHGYCGGGEEEAYEAQIRVPRNFITPIELQGTSGDGSCTLFRVADNLTPNAPALDYSQAFAPRELYENCDGALRLISVLPGGTASEIDNSAGTGPQSLILLNGREVNLTQALSDDGSRVYWTAGFGPGALYLRENADNEQSLSGECDEAGKACTIPVSETAGPGAAQFWSADPNGSKAIFSIGKALYEFDAEAEPPESRLIAGGLVGVMGVSEDASRVYLASEEASAEAQAEGAIEGKANLYLAEGGALRFIGALSKEDLALGLPSPIGRNPHERSAEVSADGLSAAFMSASSELSERTAGYENEPVKEGDCGLATNEVFAPGPCAEVYLYDASANGGKGKLICASCNPSGARPVGGPYQLGKAKLSGLFQVAASIPTWETQLYDQRALSANGKRLFFDSFDPLVPADTNGAVDVYEWEATGEGGCTEEEATFNPASGGCVRLISPGQGSSGSEFLDADESGADVFFKTVVSLLPQDPGLVDIYDARVNGGFPPPPSPPVPCEGEACQHPPAPPAEVTPASSSYQGPENETAKHKKSKKHHKKKKAKQAKRSHRGVGL